MGTLQPTAPNTGATYEPSSSASTTAIYGTVASSSSSGSSSASESTTVGTLQPTAPNTGATYEPSSSASTTAIYGTVASSSSSGSSSASESTTVGTLQPTARSTGATYESSSPASTTAIYGTVASSSSSVSTTTTKYCDEMQYINTLIAIDSLKTLPDDIPNKQDLISKGVQFSDITPSFFIDIPKGGAIIRDIHLFSSNVAEIKVTFTTETGRQTTPIRGAPTELLTSEFPREPISEIQIKVTETKDNKAPKDVTLSVIACAEGLPTLAPTTVSSEKPTTRASYTLSVTTDLSTETAGSSQPTKGTTLDASSSTPQTTTVQYCAEMEYIQTLIETDSIKTTPTDLPNKTKLITDGLDFTDRTPSFIIAVPQGGAVIRDLDLISSNIAEITVTFTTEDGKQIGPVRGAPTSLPTEQFPKDKVGKLVIKVTETTDSQAPKNVTLSVTACAEGATPATTVGTTKPTYSSAVGTTTQPDATTSPTAGITSGTTDSRTQDTTTTSPSEGTTSVESVPRTRSTTGGIESTTTSKFCDEMEYIQTLIETDAVKTSPTDIPNKQDLISKGVDFTDRIPSFIIDIPKGGAILRDLDLISSNVAEITVTFTTENGKQVGPVRGAPTSLPTEQIPKDKVSEVAIRVTRTTDNRPPQNVTLSVIACAEGVTTTTSGSIARPTYGPTSKTTNRETGGTATTQGSDGTTSVESVPRTRSTTPRTGGSTTPKFCDEMEYIQTLIDTDSVKTSPTDIPKKRDLINKGVDFTDRNPSFIIDIPKGGAIIRDLDVNSPNVEEVTVTFTTEDGKKVGPVRGAPASLPTEQFPKDKVGELVIKVTKTIDDRAPKDVTLSVIACAEGVTTTTTTGTTRPSYASSAETTTPRLSYGSSVRTTSGSDGTTSVESVPRTRSTTPRTGGSTTPKFCDEMEYIQTLIDTDSVKTSPTDIPKKRDLINKGVDFTDRNPSFIIDIPKGGAIIRDLDVNSPNVEEVTVTFTTEDGKKVGPVRGAPASLPTEQFPKDKVGELVIKVTKTIDDRAPKDVTLSVIACAEGVTTTTTTGTTRPSYASSAETTTPRLSYGSSVRTTSGSDGTTSVESVPRTRSTTPRTGSSTTPKFCDEMEYIQTLIDTDSVKTSPTDIPKKRDLINKGVDFTDRNPSFIIDIPKGGAIIRDLDVNSPNVEEVTVTFTTEDGKKVGTLRGAPASLPTEQFPKDRVSELVIKVTKTTDDRAPKDVTLSVIACAEGVTTTTTTGTTRPSYASSAETTTPRLSYGSSVRTTSGSDGTTSVESVPRTRSTTPRTGGSTTPKFCDEMEYIQTLIDTDSVKTSPTDIPKKRDLINKGVDFTDRNPSFIIDIPKGGAIIRDLDVNSPNVEEVTVTFTTEDGKKVGPVRGAPASLPTEQFPKDKVGELVIKVTKTTDDRAPQDVTLSVIACAEGVTTTTTTGTTRPSYASSAETTTPRLSYGSSVRTTSGSDGTTSVESVPRTRSTTPRTGGSTTPKFCDEMEYIQTLIDTDSVKTSPTDIPKKRDLINKGVDFTDRNPSFIIDIPKGGAIIRDLDVNSPNVEELTVTFTTENGKKVGPVRGAPASLPAEQFPKDKVGELVIEVTKTTDDRAPKDVTLSVIACAEGVTTTTSGGTTRPTYGPSSKTTIRETGGTTTTQGSDGTTSVESVPRTRSTTPRTGGSTTPKFCDEMEYIQTLIDTDSVKTSPTDIPKKRDLINKGVDFTDRNPSFIIDIPKGGAIIRDLDVNSPNVEEVTVTFTTEDGKKVGPVRGAPASLPTEQFPKDKVGELVIEVTKTTDDRAPKDVTLSVIACAEGITATASPHTTRGTYGSSTGTSGTSSEAPVSRTHSTSLGTGRTTTPKFCDEMEYIQTLINTDSVKTSPTDIPQKRDLINKGVDFTDRNPSFIIDIPQGGVIIRDLDVSSLNVVEITVTFTTEAGQQVGPIRGEPNDFPSEQLPKDKVGEIVIQVTRTKNSAPPRDVTLSITACAEGPTKTSTRVSATSTRFTLGTTASDTPTPITRPGITTTASSGPTYGTTTGTGSTASDTPTPITRPGITTTASSGPTDGTTTGTGSTASDTSTPITRPGITTTASSGPTNGTTTGTGSTASDTPTPITRPGRTTTASSGPTYGTTTGTGSTASDTPTPITRPGRTTTASSGPTYGTTTGTGSTASDTSTPITRPGITTTASSGPTNGTTTGTGSTASDTPTPITRPGRTTTASSGPTYGTTTGS